MKEMKEEAEQRKLRENRKERRGKDKIRKYVNSDSVRRSLTSKRRMAFVTP